MASPFDELKALAASASVADRVQAWSAAAAAAADTGAPSLARLARRAGCHAAQPFEDMLETLSPSRHFFKNLLQRRWRLWRRSSHSWRSRPCGPTPMQVACAAARTTWQLLPLKCGRRGCAAACCCRAEPSRRQPGRPLCRRLAAVGAAAGGAGGRVRRFPQGAGGRHREAREGGAADACACRRPGCLGPPARHAACMLRCCAARLEAVAG